MALDYEKVLELEKLPSTLMFIIRNSLYWHLTFASFLFMTKDIFLPVHRGLWNGFVISYVLCVFASLFYPYCWKKYGEQREDHLNEQKSSYQEVVNKMLHAQNVYMGLDQQEPMRKALSEMQDSIEQYEAKYFKVD